MEATAAATAGGRKRLPVAWKRDAPGSGPRVKRCLPRRSPSHGSDNFRDASRKLSDPCEGLRRGKHRFTRGPEPGASRFHATGNRFRPPAVAAAVASMRPATLAASCAAAAALAFAAITAVALEGRAVAVLHTRAANGEERRTRVWYVEQDGAIWIESATPDRPFYL